VNCPHLPPAHPGCAALVDPLHPGTGSGDANPIGSLAVEIRVTEPAGSGAQVKGPRGQRKEAARAGRHILDEEALGLLETCLRDPDEKHGHVTWP